MAERTVAWKPRSENKILGTFVERIDGVEKATGRAKYSTDINPAGTLHARLLTSPHFAKTDAEGRYRLGNLPPGRYVLKAWLDSKTTLEKPVELKAGGTLHLDFP